MYLLGIDIGSSSIKVCLLNAQGGDTIASAFSPKIEMKIVATQAGWAEQHPSAWWENLKLATQEVLSISQISKNEIKAIGISYQMHGLVCVDKAGEVIRPSIIWCDSRAVTIGNKALENIGKKKCLEHLLNSPGNFTASKLKWVKDNETALFEKIHKILLPGDYIAYKLSGVLNTTSTGLSEGILWDFKENNVAQILLKEYEFPSAIIPDLVPVFGEQSSLSKSAAEELNLEAGTLISYRAGDQPNNALSLNVLKPGEIATTAGTSGVIYGVSDKAKYDPQSRVNTFVHVNHTTENPRYGVLLCINGTGILNSWLKNNFFGLNSSMSYPEMNALAESVPVGAEGVTFLPFGNGAERILENKEIGAQLLNLSFNTHKAGHVLRAAQEGIVFALKYGLDIMKTVGVEANTVRAGKANMFLSPVFTKTFATICDTKVELYNTDGAQGAARGAGVGANIYKDFTEAFSGLKILETVFPDDQNKSAYQDAYERWVAALNKALKK